MRKGAGFARFYSFRPVTPPRRT